MGADIEQWFAPETHVKGFSASAKDFQRVRTVNKGHGRHEERTLTTSSLLNDYLDWPGVAQVFRLECRSINTANGEVRHEVVYGITSLSAHKADAKRLNGLVRQYWGIENGLHYRRDKPLQEDATRRGGEVTTVNVVDVWKPDTAGAGGEAAAAAEGLAPNWRHVGAFLGVTFGLTWLLDLVVYLRGGLAAPGMLTILQFQMLLPAFSAIVLGLFFFPESPLYRGRPANRGRWFYYYFLLLTVVYAASALAALLNPGQQTIAALASSVPLLLSFVGLILLVALRLAAGREAMARVWLSWGSPRYWLLFGGAIAAWYVLQAALNAATGLGGARLAPLPAPPGLSPTMVLVVAAVQTVLLGPVLGIVITFGEEYGWRGYLQTELFKMGRVRGVLLLGVIWGAWHSPIILMGYNYPQHPLLGVLLMTLYSTGLAVVLGYAVLKSGSVLLATYLHAVNNQVAAFIVALGFRPYDMAFSFMIGIYGIALVAVVALLILRDPIWRGKGSTLQKVD